MEKKLKKKMLVALLAAVVGMGVSTPFEAWAEENVAEIDCEESVEEVLAEDVVMQTGVKVVKSGKCGKNVTYKLDSNGTLTISGKGKMTNYKGDGSPFNQTYEIKKVVVKNGVTSIGDAAFIMCHGLTKVELADSVKSIGKNAFAECLSLKSVTMPNGLTKIGSGAFSDCISLTSITIPEGVTSIPEAAFYDCASLKKIEIPESVVSIENDAFGCCSAIKSFEISKNVASIGNQAFGGRIDTTIGKRPFSGKIKVDKENLYYSSKDGVLYNKDKTELMCVPASVKGTYKVLDGVKKIGDYAFSGCDKLTKVTMPKSVTSIGEGAFWECKKLKTVKIPKTVTNIGASAFSYCISLTSITLPDGLTSISDSMFYFGALESIKIPTSVTSIGNAAFYACELSSVDFPDGLISIGGSAFYGCNLTSVDLPKGITEISDGTFALNREMYSVEIPKSVTSIGNYAFQLCGNLGSVVIPESVTYIGEGAFSVSSKGYISLQVKRGSLAHIYAVENNLPFKETGQAEQLANFTVGTNKYKMTGKNTVAFTGIKDNKTKKVIIPKTIKFGGKTFQVTSVADGALNKNKQVTTVTLGENVQTIGADAFRGCKKLGTLTIKTTKLKAVDANALKGIKSTARIKVPAKKLAAYKALLKNKGQGKRVKVIK